MISIVAPDARTREMWRALMDIARRQPSGWTLIGAQMVALHGFQHQRVLQRSSLDADVLVNVRVIQNGTERLSWVLLEAGFELAGMSADGIGHRFRNGAVDIDLLAPDGLGSRTDLTTVPPAHTIQVPGGTQAMERSEIVQVALENEVGAIPRPSLLGAILLKARAIEVDDVPGQQQQDLAFLLSLVDDPRLLAESLKPRERTWLKRHIRSLAIGSTAWWGVEEAQSGFAALRILIGA